MIRAPAAPRVAVEVLEQHVAAHDVARTAAAERQQRAAPGAVLEGPMELAARR
jgi:hypothetical protein